MGADKVVESKVNGFPRVFASDVRRDGNIGKYAGGESGPEGRKLMKMKLFIAVSRRFRASFLWNEKLLESQNRGLIGKCPT